MQRLAEWHATLTVPVRVETVRRVAEHLAQCGVSKESVRALLRRRDWWAYREELALDEMLQVRKRVERRSKAYVDAHFQALQAALVNVGENPKLVADIATPVVDRVWPKREERAATSPTVVINLAGGTTVQQVLATEVLPVEIVEEGT